MKIFAPLLDHIRRSLCLSSRPSYLQYLWGAAEVTKFQSEVEALQFGSLELSS